MTSGPSLPSSMSTPATFRPMICAERTATCSYSGESSTGSTVPPRCTFDRNSSPVATRRMAATTRSPTTRARMSRPRLSAMNRWISTFCFVECSVSMIASATFTSGARITPMPWVPSSSLITTGRAADELDRGPHVGAVAHERRRRHADVVPGEDLVRAQLVARVRDAVRGVRRVDVHLLELAHHGGAEVRDRVADARHDRVVVRQRTAAVLQVGLGPREVDRETQGVQHLHAVSALQRRCAESLRGVRLRGAREDRQFHR